MSQIDTYSARNGWAKNGKTECDYLDAIEFVALDEEGRITLPTDEEANNTIILTPRAARHVAEQLKAYADSVEKTR